MQAEMFPADHQLRPMIGPGGLTWEQAHGEIQGLLDGGGTKLATAAATWRAGAKDDTVHHGPLIWCIYEHQDGEDPRIAARLWLEDLAQIMREAGADVQVAKPPGR